MASPFGQDRISDRVVHFISPRSGGPYKQHALLAKALRQHGYISYHYSSLWRWLRLHFNRTDIIISGVPFLWIPDKKKFLLNIRGDFRKERSWRNALSALYPHTIRHTEKIIVPSEFLKKQLGLKRAHVISNAIEHQKPATAQSEEPRIIRIGTSMSFDFL